MQHLLKVPACNRALSNQCLRVLLQRRLHFCFETTFPPPPLHIWRSGYATVLDKMLDWNTKHSLYQTKRFLSRLLHLLQKLEKWIKWRKFRQTQIFENFIPEVPSLLFHIFAPQILGIFFWKVLVCQKLSSSLISKKVPRKLRYNYIILMSKFHLQKNHFLVCLCVTDHCFQTHHWRINKKGNLGIWYDRGNFFCVL